MSRLKKLNYYLITLVSIVLLVGLFSRQVYTRDKIAGYPDFEIVESAPIETNLNSKKIRDTRTVWLEMINGAQKTLEIETMYMVSKPGELLEEVIAAIINAGKRGVKVRIISAAEFYEGYTKTIDSLKKSKNIKVRLINMGEMTGGIMHAKYFIVDGNQVFLGSQNFDWRALKHIREIGVRIKNEEFARILSDLFELDWKLAALKNPGSFKNYLIKKDYSFPIKMKERKGTIVEFYPVYTPSKFIPDERLWEEKHILKLISNAKREVFIHLLSYSPVTPRSPEFYPALDNALRSAAARGVQVRLIISDWAKYPPKIDHLKSLTLVPNIEVRLSTIPEYSQGFISFARVEHSKYLVVDNDKSWVGSSNWEKDYFYKSRNVGVVIKSKRINEILKEVFLSTWKGPYAYPLKPEVDYPPPKVTDEEESKE